MQRILTVAGIALLSMLPAGAAELAHRYSFEIDGRDSMGGAAGVLQGEATIHSGALHTDRYPKSSGLLVQAFILPNSSIADLSSSFSIETWFSLTPQQTSAHYATIFAFGGSISRTVTAVLQRYNFGEPEEYWFNSSLSISHYPPPPQPSYPGEFRPFETIVPGTTLPKGLTQYVSTYDALTRTMTLSIDGVLVSSAVLKHAGTFDLPSLALDERFVAGVGGQSPYGDVSLGGSTHDFRLYRGVLSASEIAALHALGPDPSNEMLIAAIPEPDILGLILAGAFLLSLTSVRRSQSKKSLR